MRVGIRREDKNEWEARVPLIPNDVKKLVSDGIEVRSEEHTSELQSH